jgi:deoxyguanosine kinase
MTERSVNEKKENLQQRHPYVALFGPVGIGKTTFSEFFANGTEIKLLQEHYPDNPYLHDFYTKNPADFSFNSQIFFLANKGVQVKEISELTKEAPVILDPGHETDFVIATVQYKMGWMTDEEYSLYVNTFNNVYKDTLNPDVYIAFTGSEEKIVENILKRGREMELTMHERFPDYFPMIVREFNMLLDDSTAPVAKHVVKVDTDKFDILGSEEKRTEIIKETKDWLNYQISSPTQRGMMGSDGTRLIILDSFKAAPHYIDRVPGAKLSY